MKNLIKLSVAVIVSAALIITMVFSAGNVPGKDLSTKGEAALDAGSRVEIQLRIPNSNKIYVLSKDEVSEVLKCITNQKDIIEKKLPVTAINEKENPSLSIRFDSGSVDKEKVISLINMSNGYIVNDGKEKDFLIISQLDSVINRILTIHS